MQQQNPAGDDLSERERARRAKQRAQSLADRSLQPIFVSIDDTALVLSVSTWTVKDLLRRRVLRAKKAGRRALIEGDSIREYASALPSAEFLPPRQAAG